VTPSDNGTLSLILMQPKAREYEFWLGGSIAGSLELRLDGERVERVTGQLNNDGQYVSLGQAALRPGANEVELDYTRGGWRPGSDVPQEPVGPLVLRPVSGAEPILSVSPARSQKLCDRRLDWLELVEG
jgi:hypothetical protein